MEGAVIANVSWVSARLWFVFGQCPLCCVVLHNATRRKTIGIRKGESGMQGV